MICVLQPQLVLKYTRLLDERELSEWVIHCIYIVSLPRRELQRSESLLVWAYEEKDTHLSDSLKCH